MLHTVIFGRALGVVRPRDVDCELFDLTYVTCGDAEAERAVDEKLDALVAWLRKQDLRPGGPDVCAQVALSFYERRDKGVDGSVGGRNARVGSSGGHARGVRGRRPGCERARTAFLELQDVLRGAVQHALGLVNEKRDHIPPVVSADVVVPVRHRTPGGHGERVRHAQADDDAREPAEHDHVTTMWARWDDEYRGRETRRVDRRTRGSRG